MLFLKLECTFYYLFFICFFGTKILLSELKRLSINLHAVRRWQNLLLVLIVLYSIFQIYLSHFHKHTYSSKTADVIVRSAFNWLLFVLYSMSVPIISTQYTQCKLYIYNTNCLFHPDRSFNHFKECRTSGKSRILPLFQFLQTRLTTSKQANI